MDIEVNSCGPRMLFGRVLMIKLYCLKEFWLPLVLKSHRCISFCNCFTEISSIAT